MLAIDLAVVPETSFRAAMSLGNVGPSRPCIMPKLNKIYYQLLTREPALLLGPPPAGGAEYLYRAIVLNAFPGRCSGRVGSQKGTHDVQAEKG